MGEEQDLNPEISGKFFESKVLNIDQSCLTENGMEYVNAYMLIFLFSLLLNLRKTVEILKNCFLYSELVYH